MSADDTGALAEVVHPNRNDERDVRPWRASDGDLRCQKCGRPNVVWYADNDLWNRVMPDDGILCIGCFIHRAEAFIGVAAWGLFADAAPFRGEFRRGFEAGLAARVEQARAGEGALRDLLSADSTREGMKAAIKHAAMDRFASEHLADDARAWLAGFSATAALDYLRAALTEDQS